jgi:hypothetical protein
VTNDNNYIIPLFIAGTLVLVLFAFFLIAYLIVQKNKQNAYHLEKQRLIFDYQNEILRTKLEAQERTMNEISKDLHDNVGQLLSLVQMNMYLIAENAPNEKQKQIVERTNGLVEQAVTDLRNISHSMNNNFIERLGLVDVMKKELENIGLSRSISCDIEVRGDNTALHAEKELMIYRIAQEATHNILKHAKASIINIILIFEEDSFEMHITDNGVGFSKDKLYDMNGLGLLNMFQRAKFLGGNLDIKSEPMKGSTISLKINNVNTNMDAYSVSDS